MPLPRRLDAADVRITGWMARHGVRLTRIALGVVFTWFGALKFFPDLSPAADLASRTIERLTFGLVPASVGLPVLAAWELLIGVGLLFGRYLRFVLLLLFLQMAGTLLPPVPVPGGDLPRVPLRAHARGPVHPQERRARRGRDRDRFHGAQWRAAPRNAPEPRRSHPARSALSVIATKIRPGSWRSALKAA